ncbi:MAG TPA: nuclear transport factor 2 family protein [Candidatus Acidoferrum sp.]|nr:nuclear transport factor 2 family protein [Candidatus Acidoferrum sp.]
MKAVRVCVVLALTMLPGFGQSAYDSQKARIVALENAWNEAEKHKDAKAIAGLLAPSFSYTDSDGSFMNKQQYLASITEAGYRPDQIVNDSMSVQAYEHAAVVTGTYKEKGAEKGKSYSRRGRFTDMWVEEKGGWLCAASHETLIGK